MKLLNNKKFRPYVPADKNPPEFTITSLVMGIIIAVVFGGVNAYLGLRVGMTVSASIPAAVISMGLIRVIMKRDSILENNMVQTIGSAGESLAAGAIFTLPVLFMWSKESGTKMPEFWEIALISICGGILGVLFMVPLRNALIVKEHGKLPFPEGTACAEVLEAGENDKKKSGLVFSGLGIAAVYKFLADGIGLFPSELHWEIKKVKGAGIGIDVLPALVSVGYICGKKIASYMFSGGIISWLVLMPIIALFGGNSVLYPGEIPISDMATRKIWSLYIRYIGAGAVAAGGIISLIKSLPVIANTFYSAIKGFGKRSLNDLRTEKEIPIPIVLAGLIFVMLFIWLVPVIPVGLGGALIIVVFGFFFATVSSRMVGLVGSSNNPVSGMAIATLLVSTILLKSAGETGYAGMITAICIGTIICIIAAMAGDTSQDLKTGFLVGATPLKQQIGELAGVLSAGIAVGGVMYLLDMAWGFGSSQLPAPQATLMKVIVEGVMGGNLPWALIFAGVGIAIAIEILGIPVLPVAVGMYLPIHLSVPIFIGGIIRWIVEKKKDKSLTENGILYSSGMIAGEGLVGIIIAILAVIPFNESNVADIINMDGILGQAGAIIFFILVVAVLWFNSVRKIE